MSNKKEDAVLAYDASIRRIGRFVADNREKVDLFAKEYGKGYIRGVLLTTLKDKKMYREKDPKIGFQFNDLENLVDRGILPMFPEVRTALDKYDPQKQFVLLIHIPAINYCQTVTYYLNKPFSLKQVERNKKKGQSAIDQDEVRQTAAPKVPYQICRNCLMTLEGDSEKLLRCSRCKLAYYCNQKCQREDWKKSHSVECDTMADVQDEFIDSMCGNEDELIMKEMSHSVIFNKLYELNSEEKKEDSP